MAEKTDVNAKWDACLDLSVRRVVYSSLAGAFGGLLLFRITCKDGMSQENIKCSQGVNTSEYSQCSCFSGFSVYHCVLHSFCLLYLDNLSLSTHGSKTFSRIMTKMMARNEKCYMKLSSSCLVTDQNFLKNEIAVKEESQGSVATGPKCSRLTKSTRESKRSPTQIFADFDEHHGYYHYGTIAYAREIVQNIWNALVMTCKEGVEPGSAQATVVPGWHSSLH
ncbi:hypothetical protein D5086_033574 [Populus alba]|uniref:Uncharacterized protein n=1 Tax=Populus alba TaxID=43335 RepID=A0ACC4AH56_POPAL